MANPLTKLTLDTEKGRARWTPPATCTDAKGLIVGDPVAHGYDRDKWQWLRRKDFATELAWLDFRASDLELHAADLQRKASECRAEAELLRKHGGNPVAQRAAQKAAKLTASLAALRAELAAQGVNLDDVLGQS